MIWWSTIALLLRLLRDTSVNFSTLSHFPNTRYFSIFGWRRNWDVKMSPSRIFLLYITHKAYNFVIKMWNVCIWCECVLFTLQWIIFIERPKYFDTVVTLLVSSNVKNLWFGLYEKGPKFYPLKCLKIAWILEMDFETISDRELELCMVIDLDSTHKVGNALRSPRVSWGTFFWIE